jgi:DNA-binding beta-propeller fold protein YncE
MRLSCSFGHPGPVRRALLALPLVVVLAACGGKSHSAAVQQKPAARPVTVRPLAVDPTPALVARQLGSLTAAVQNSASAPGPGSSVVLLGGLTPADVSTAAITLVRRSSGRALGSLPGALHDAAAVNLGGSVYLFGGGDGVRQLDGIIRIDPATGRTTSVGRLPAGSSDSAATALNGTAYVVGGFTGTRWLDTILAWKPGSAPRVAGRLPTPLRYAAVAAVDGRIVIAGGSTPAGTASRAVLAFDPTTGKIRRVGLLPAPTTHAAAATLGDVAYVLGGRGATTGTPTDRVVAVDPDRRLVKPAGTLPTALSDLMAQPLGGAILVAGGKGAVGTTAALTALVRSRHSAAVKTYAVPALVSKTNVYAADRAGELSPAVANDPPLVYVPNSQSATVDVISQRTFKVVHHYAVGALPQHVTPSYDLRTLWVDNDVGNSLTPLDPRTGTPKGPPVPVDDPYNLYFTPDGQFAIVVAERLHRLDFRDAQTMALRHSLAVPCAGVDHMDFTADGTHALASCEFSGEMLWLDIPNQRIVSTIHLPRAGATPQDVKLSPDGRVFYVADMVANGLWEISARRPHLIGFLPTGRGVHGLYPSRDARYLYATNRGEGSISVISFRTRRVVTKWHIAGGGSPDMGGVSADGKVLWLSGRYSGVVYAISTANGRLLAKIPVGSGPHGLCVWPQPGRYSLGHTGILR